MHDYTHTHTRTRTHAHAHTHTHTHTHGRTCLSKCSVCRAVRYLNIFRALPDQLPRYFVRHLSLKYLDTLLACEAELSRYFI